MTFLKKKNSKYVFQRIRNRFLHTYTAQGNQCHYIQDNYEYSEWFYISCPVIWKSLFISAFCAYRIIISVETLVKTATHRRCGKVLTNIPAEMDKSSSTKEAISEYRNSDFQISGSVISSHKNIQITQNNNCNTFTPHSFSCLFFESPGFQYCMIIF